MPSQRAPEDAADVKAFIADLKERLGLKTTRDLARKLGWAETDKERKLYRWAAGEYAPRFNETLLLLRAADMLQDQPKRSRRKGTAAEEATRDDALVTLQHDVQAVLGAVQEMMRRLEQFAGPDAAQWRSRAVDEVARLQPRQARRTSS